MKKQSKAHGKPSQSSSRTLKSLKSSKKSSKSSKPSSVFPAFILASSSPRRKELMMNLGFRPRILSPEVDETPLKGESPKALVRRLARLKARAVLSMGVKETEPHFVLAADTIVVEPSGKNILGKPRNALEAKKMLASLSGKAHKVFTGYCLIFQEGAPRFSESELTRVVETKVKMKALSKQVIEFYVKTGEPMDKAGAYAAQGLGMGLIDSVSGSYSNVVGLPVNAVIGDLLDVFGVEPFSWIEA